MKLVSFRPNSLHGQSKGCWLCIHIGYTMIFFHRFWNPKSDAQGIRIRLHAPRHSQDGGGLGRWGVALTIMLLLASCTSLTPAQKAAYSDAASTLGSAVVNNVASAATSDLQNGQPNQAALESAAVFGLFGGVSQIIGNGDASTIISSFSNHTMPKTAAAVKAIPPTSANLAAIATVISTVNGVPPAK